MTSAEILLVQAEARSSAIWGRRTGPALDQVAQDYEHYRQAFDGLINRGNADQAARFVVALRDFWWARGRVAEGMVWIDRVLAQPGLSPTNRALVLDQAGALAFAEANYAKARSFFHASVDKRRTGESKSALALSLNHLAAAVRWGGADARALCGTGCCEPASCPSVPSASCAS